MAIKINLLPTELKLSKGTAQALKVTRMLGVIALAVFLVFGFLLGGFFVISSVELKNVNEANDSLKSQIRALQTSEAQMVVLKDRIAKIRAIEKLPSALDNFNNFEPILSDLPGTTEVSGLEIDSTEVETTMIFKTNADIKSFVERLTGTETFKSVDFDSFSFNPATGYTVSMTIVSQ
ncbi:MAG TPA: hypothetical protein VJ227_04080 [Patescibacteria group bacterium]|nr:hypothetical protein [Patescibacteria group bacterium]